MTLDELVDLVQDGRGRFDGAEQVDDFAHALQTAALAHDAGAAPDLVAAALLHDVAHHPHLRARHPGVSHAALAADLLAPLLGERAAFAVRHHVAAKRHLAAAEPGYPLSPASRASLTRQGGPALLPELTDDWGRWALQLRRWDDLAKVPKTPEQTDLLDAVRALAPPA